MRPGASHASLLSPDLDTSDVSDDASGTSLLSPDLDTSDVSDDASGTKAVPRRPSMMGGEEKSPAETGQA